MNCPHGFEKPSQCIECMEEGPIAEPSKWAKVEGVFKAKYPGWCRCGTNIAIGDAVQRWDKGDEETAYLHEGCRP